MTTAELITELKQKDSLLPQAVLKDSSLQELATQLTEIFETKQEELLGDDKFRNNFTELINYIYLNTLTKQPERRNKSIFAENLISFLLNAPHPAV